MRALATIVVTLALAAPAVAGTLSTVTVDVQDAELTNIVRLLADVGGVNVVIADDVKGKVTVKLKRVSWRTALDVVLKSNGYGVVQEDGVLWVTSQARIDADEQRALDLADQRAQRGPLTTRMIPVNNARAADLAELVKPLLSKRGSVTFDARTNTLIVRDVAGSAALVR